MLKNHEKRHCFQEIRGYYKEVSVFPILVSVGIFQFKWERGAEGTVVLIAPVPGHSLLLIFVCSGNIYMPGTK